MTRGFPSAGDVRAARLYALYICVWGCVAAIASGQHGDTHAHGGSQPPSHGTGGPPPPTSPWGDQLDGCYESQMPGCRESLVLGGLFPLSGPDCVEGTFALRGALRAVEELNKAGADSPRIIMRVNNTKGSPSQALLAANQLDRVGVDAVIGCYDSEVTKIVSMLLRVDKTPIVSYYAPDTPGHDYFLRTYPSDQSLMQALASYVLMMQWEALHFITPFGSDNSLAVHYFERHVPRARVLVGLLHDDDKHIYSTLHKIKSHSHWRVIVLHCKETMAARVLRIAQGLGLLESGWVWVGTDWTSSDAIWHHREHEAAAANAWHSTTRRLHEHTQDSDAASAGHVTGTLSVEALMAAGLGIVGVRPAVFSTRKAKELLTFPKEGFTAHELARCADLAHLQEVDVAILHAYDAVMAVGAGGQALFQASNGSSGWQSRRTAALKDLILQGKTEGATMEVAFDQDGGMIFNSYEISNFVRVATSVEPSGFSFKTVGSITAGNISMREKVHWIGGSTDEPSDRSPAHDVGPALYLTVFLIVIIAAVMGGNALHHAHVTVLPEAGLTVLIGIGTGLVVEYCMGEEFIELARFDEHLFVLALLPVIIFEAGFNTNTERFSKNLGPILIFAVIGTTISTFFIGGLLYYAGLHGLVSVKLSGAESLTFGALISAVDPVATLAIFGSLRVERDLNMRVFGESIINDAVSIVLYRVFARFITEAVTIGSIFRAGFTLFYISIGSVGLGFATAAVASLLLKHACPHDSMAAAGLFVIFSYIVFEVSEAVHLSGIVAALFCGFWMRYWTVQNLDTEAATLAAESLKMLAALSDMAIFLMVGENTILFASMKNWGFIILTIVLCLLGRAANIFPLSAMYNATVSTEHAERKIPMRQQVVMVHSGLRGAIAFALSLSFPSQHRKVIVDTTAWVTLFTIFFLGGSTTAVLKALGIEMGLADEVQTQGDEEEGEGEGEGEGFPERRKRSLSKRFDSKVLTPFFTSTNGPILPDHAHESGGGGGEEGAEGTAQTAVSPRMTALQAGEWQMASHATTPNRARRTSSATDPQTGERVAPVKIQMTPRGHDEHGGQANMGETQGRQRSLSGSFSKKVDEKRRPNLSLSLTDSGDEDSGSAASSREDPGPHTAAAAHVPNPLAFSSPPGANVDHPDELSPRSQSIWQAHSDFVEDDADDDAI